jgi:16S rRNA processing protein RimM
MSNDELAIVGRLHRPHGIRGALVVEPLTDAPDATFATGRRVFAGTADGAVWRDPKTKALRELVVTASKPFKDGLIVSFDAIGDRTEAERWTGRFVLAPFIELEPPDEDEFYLHELDGLTAVNDSGQTVGTVSAWYQMPHGILLDIRTPRGEVSIPYSDRFVLAVDRDARRITVDIPGELFDNGPDGPEPR